MPAKNTPAIDPALIAAIAQAVIAQTTAHEEVGVVVEASEPKRKTPAKSPTKKTPARKTAKAKPGVITCGSAWEALGADPEYAPKDPSKPATAPQLWRLNSEGLLPALLA